MLLEWFRGTSQLTSIFISTRIAILQQNIFHMIRSHQQRYGRKNASQTSQKISKIVAFIYLAYEL